MQTNWRLVWLLFIVGLFAAAQFGKISLGLDALGQAYDRPATGLALVVSLVGVTGMIFGVTAGAIVARIGMRQALLTALLLGAAVSFFQASLPPYPLFLISRVLEGVSHLTIVVAAPTLMAAISRDRDTPVVMGIWGMFFGVSFAITAALLPILLPMIGVSGVYAAHGAALALLALLLAPLIPNLKTRTDRQGWFVLHARIYARARMFTPALTFFWHTLIFVALLTFLAGALNADWLAPILPLISLVGTFAAGVLARNRAPDLIAKLAFLGTIFCLVVLVTTDALWIVFPMFFLIGVVPGASFAAIPYYNATAADQAGANGAMAQLGNVGTALGTPIFAICLAAWGPDGMLWLTAGICLLGFIAVIVAGHLIKSQDI